MKTFEYKFELNLGETETPGDDDRSEEALNRLGSEGWELVAVSACGKNNSYTGFWFKREKL